MSARILIVDDLFPNVKLLETKLSDGLTPPTPVSSGDQP